MGYFLYVCSDVEVNVLEGGVVDALFLETDLVFDGEEDDVMELQVGEEVSMTVMLRVVMLLQSESCLIVLCVPGLCIKVEAEVEHEGGEGRRAEASGGVQSHEEGEEVLQLLEDGHEVVGFSLAFEGEVAKDLFIGLGSPGQFLVLGLQLNDMSDLVLNRGKAIEGHFGGDRQMIRRQLQFCRKLDGHWRVPARHAGHCHNGRGGTKQASKHTSKQARGKRI